MPTSPVDEILGRLGLGDPIAQPVRPQRAAPQREAGSVAREERLAARENLSLWRARNDNAQWIELRGPLATFRATRPKVNLLLSLQPVIQAWADGARPISKATDLTIRTVSRPEGLRLEISYRHWKPIRLCRRQARGLTMFSKEIADFAASRS